MPSPRTSVITEEIISEAAAIAEAIAVMPRRFQMQAVLAAKFFSVQEMG
jgi:hypothetical protein